MRRTILCGLCVVAAALSSSGPVQAHHNMSALFDFNDRITLNGKLSKINWTNPHIQLVVDKSGEPAEAWAFEGPAPGFFRQRNVLKDDFTTAVGKSVTVEASRARDGSRSALLRTITLPGDKVVTVCPQFC